MTRSAVVDGRAMRGGAVPVAGFKHAFVSVVCTAVAANVAVRIENAPDVLDVSVLGEILDRCGARVRQDGTVFFMDPSTLAHGRVPAELSEQIHGSIYLIPALLARLGEVQIGPSGGCRIGDGDGGARPFNHVIDVMRRFGATVWTREGHVFGTSKQLMPVEIDTRTFSTDVDGRSGPYISGVTKTAIMAGAGAGGFDLVGGYGKVDVTAPLDLLSKSGFSVHRFEEGKWLVRRKDTNVDDHAVCLRLPPDLVEIMTFVTLSVLRKVDVAMLKVPPSTAEFMRAEVRLLERMGVCLLWAQDAVLIGHSGPVRPTHIKVDNHVDSIYSDHQPFLSLLLLGAEGSSTIRDAVWCNRFQYVDELVRAGATIERTGRGVVTIAPSRLSPPVGGFSGSDLRSVGTLLLAALCMDRPVRISGIEHLARGYADLFGKLRRLGAEIHDE